MTSPQSTVSYLVQPNLNAWLYPRTLSVQYCECSTGQASGIRVTLSLISWMIAATFLKDNMTL